MLPSAVLLFAAGPLAATQQDGYYSRRINKTSVNTHSSMTINKTSVNNPMNEITAVTTSTNSKNPIYQASGGKLGITKLKSAGFPQGVEAIFENGTMNGVGKVTNLEAWIVYRRAWVWSWSNN